MRGDWMTKILDNQGGFLTSLTGKTAMDFDTGDATFIPYMNVFSNTFTNISDLRSVNVGSDESQNAVAKGDVFFYYFFGNTRRSGNVERSARRNRELLLKLILCSVSLRRRKITESCFSWLPSPISTGKSTFISWRARCNALQHLEDDIPQSASSAPFGSPSSRRSPTVSARWTT